jgi:hypothetical protein
MRRHFTLGEVIKRLRTEDRGFGLVETVMAMGILFMALMVLAYAALVGFKDAGVARQRQAADGIVNKLMEQVRALPYATVSKGLADSDLSSDSNIVGCGTKYYYKTCSGEEIVHTNGLPTTTPLVPHKGTYGASQGYPVTYSWATYVTKASNAPTAGGYRVRVVVTWNGAERATSASVTTDSIVFQPKSTIDSDTHVVGATGAFFFSSGTITRGTINVTPVTSSGNPTGIELLPSWNSATLSLENLDSNLQSEQLTSISANVNNAGGVLDTGTLASFGGSGATSKADDDTTTSTGTYSSNTATNSGSTSQSLCGGPGPTYFNCVTIYQVAAGDRGDTTSATSATGSTPCNGQIDSRPCVYSQAAMEQSESIRLDMRGSVPTNTLRTADVAYITNPSSGATVYENAYGRKTSAGTVKETVKRVFSAYSSAFGDLITQSGNQNRPNGWAGYWIGLFPPAGDWMPTATAEAGPGAASPTVTLPAGAVVKAWNGNGYTSIAVNSTGGTICSSGCTYSITPLSYCWKINPSLSYKFDIDGSFTIGQSYTVRTPSSGTPITDAQAVIGSPLTGTMTYVVKKHDASSCNAAGPSELVNLKFKIDLGSAVAHAVYKPAP